MLQKISNCTNGQELYRHQREMRLSYHVARAETRGSQPWAGVLMLCLGLVLFLSQWKRVRNYLRRRYDAQIPGSPAR